jgi:hypothetical protein
MPDLRQTIHVDASAEVVYDLLADLPRMGEWSPECERVTWRAGATGAVRGARFFGHNRAGALRWMTQGEVVSAARGRNLTFEISFGPMAIARWEYFIVPGESGCTLVEEWTDRRPAWYRGPADRTFGPRLKTNRRGIQVTLDNLKRAAERVATA